MARKLKGMRVAVLATDGFEQVELLSPLEALKAEGAKVEVVSLAPGSIQGVQGMEPGKRVHVDRTLEQVEPADFDALVLPGGLKNPDTLRQSERVREFVRAFDRAAKPIAVICHGPWILGSAGLLSGRRLTSWPGIRDDVQNAGGIWLDQEFVRDRNWVSSRGPQDIAAFDREMVSLFASRVPVRMRRPVRAGVGAWLARGLALVVAGLAVRRFVLPLRLGA